MTGAPAETASTAAAFFDVDGTLVDCNIVEYYVYFRRKSMSSMSAMLWHKLYMLKCLYYLVLDSVDRTRFNLAFYRDYRGLHSAKTKVLAAECYRDIMQHAQFAQVPACIDEHRRAGHRLVLVTGSLDFIMRPLVDDLGFDDLIAATLVESNGVFTGSLAGPPIGQEEKARRVREFAEAQGVDLSRSHAYGDSMADLPMLEAVGFPHAVNPGRGLARIARARGWPVHRWTRAVGASPLVGVGDG